MWRASRSKRSRWVSQESASASSDGEKKPARRSSASRCGCRVLSAVTSGRASATQDQASPAKARSAGRSRVRSGPRAGRTVRLIRIAAGRGGKGAADAPVGAGSGKSSSGRHVPSMATSVAIAVTRSSPSYQSYPSSLPSASNRRDAMPARSAARQRAWASGGSGIAGHDQRVMVRFGELRRFAPVVDIGGARAPGTQDRRRRCDSDAGFAGLLPVVEGGARTGGRTPWRGRSQTLRRGASPSGNRSRRLPSLPEAPARVRDSRRPRIGSGAGNRRERSRGRHGRSRPRAGRPAGSGRGKLRSGSL